MLWGALPTRAMRATAKGWGQEDSPTASLAWCPAPPTSAPKGAQEMSFPQCSAGQGAIKPQEVPSPEVHNQLPEQNQKEG